MARIVFLAIVLAALCYVTQAVPAIDEDMEDVESEVISLSDIHDETSEADKKIEENLEGMLVELEGKIAELTGNLKKNIEEENYFLDGLKKFFEKWIKGNVRKIKEDLKEIRKKREKFVKDLLDKIERALKGFYPKVVSKVLTEN